MIVGVPKEIKADEYRVAMLPVGAEELTSAGHTVLIEGGAGQGSGIPDTHYMAAGAMIVEGPESIWSKADLIVKVKEPQAVEWTRIRPGQTIFTYFHFAADEALTKAMLKSESTAIAYETVTGPRGGLPLLAPMSEVAGRMAVQAGAHCLEMEQGGRGVLLGGVPGVAPARVTVIGGGVAGYHAARIGVGMGAEVTVLDKSLPRLRYLADIFGASLRTIYATRAAIEESVLKSDLVIGAVLVPGAAAPKLVRREHLAKMRPGSVLVDISIDQGGCFETSRATTHQDPTYVVDGVVHYCVANMPGAVPRTSTFALNNATLPFTLALADLGWKEACRRDPHLRSGLNIHAGNLYCEAVAQAQSMACPPVEEALAD